MPNGCGANERMRGARWQLTRGLDDSALCGRQGKHGDQARANGSSFPEANGSTFQENASALRDAIAHASKSGW